MTILADRDWSWADPRPGGKAWVGHAGEVVPPELPADVIAALLHMWRRFPGERVAVVIPPNVTPPKADPGASSGVVADIDPKDNPPLAAGLPLVLG
jgi:hypothetical protein